VTSNNPQGSVLGPIISLFYINNLDAGIQDIVLKFAGDTTLLATVQNDYHHHILHTYLINIADQSRTWQMEFNIAKCNVIHIGGSDTKSPDYMDEQKLSAKSEGCDLVIIVSETLQVS
jgi:Reverse transcriptase (RNA-dependent DNA polymerase)